MAKAWFQKAVMDKPPYKLGWHKNMTFDNRIRASLNSRPGNWSDERKLLSSARALTALANVTRDAETRRLARLDAHYLLSGYNYGRR